MIDFINNSVPIVGTVMIFYVLLSKRINTSCVEFGIFFNSSVLLWLLLFWADWTDDFNPVWQTTSARVIILIMVLCVMRAAWIKTDK